MRATPSGQKQLHLERPDSLQTHLAVKCAAHQRMRAGARAPWYLEPCLGGGVHCKVQGALQYPSQKQIYATVDRVEGYAFESLWPEIPVIWGDNIFVNLAISTYQTRTTGTL